MRIFGKILTAFPVFFFFCFLFAAPSTADIISVNTRSHNRDIILFSEFEYSNTGYVSVAVSSVGISSIPITSTSSQPDPSRIGFFLLSNELRRRYNLEFKRNPNLCALDIKFISVLFTFKDLSPPPQSSFNKSYHVTYPGDYSLYFVNCNELSLVTMDVRAELYNTADDGTAKDYLSAEQPQPSLYYKFFIVYLCFLGLWINTCVKNRKYFQRLHLVMGVLLVMALFHLLCAAADQQDLKATGTHHGWHHVLFYISQFMRNVLFSGVIILIGIGWCIWRPFLPGWAIVVLKIMILLQVWANVSCKAVRETGPYNKDWRDLNDWFMFIDFICYAFVLIFTCCSSRIFIEATDTSTFVRSFDSLKETSARPDVFCVLLFLYVVFRFLARETETSNLFFSVVMFYLFRPFDLDNEGEKACRISRLL